MNDMPGILLFSLIAMRMSGFILLNPVFGRRNIPNIVKAGFILFLSYHMFLVSDSRGMTIDIVNSLDYGILLLKEFSVGFVVGFVMQLFFYITSYAGGMIDFYMGMSMANIYDPQNNASMPLTGTIFNAMLIMLFFAVDGHLAIIKILMQSEQIVPYAQIAYTPQSISLVLELFKECTVLAVKLSFPILALELLGEVGIGILMKVIPQINVFIINIQTKVLIGNFLILLLCIPIGHFFSDVIDNMVRTIGQIMTWF